MVVNFTLDTIGEAAARLLSIAGNRKVFALHGEMGAGKTTLVHHCCLQLGVVATTGSPTFSIINEYVSGEGNPLYHIDLYRLKDEQEAIAAGVEECLYSGNTCFVEWPEKAPGILPDDCIHCYLSLDGNNARKLRINL